MEVTSLIKRLVRFGVQCLILGFCSSCLLSGSLGVSTLAEKDEEAESGVQVAHLRQWEQMETTALSAPSTGWAPLDRLLRSLDSLSWWNMIENCAEETMFYVSPHVLGLNSRVLLGNNVTHWDLFSNSFLSAVRSKGCLLLDVFMVAPELEMWSKCMFLLETC